MCDGNDDKFSKGAFSLMFFWKAEFFLYKSNEYIAILPKYGCINGMQTIEKTSFFLVKFQEEGLYQAILSIGSLILAQSFQREK